MRPFDRISHCGLSAVRLNAPDGSAVIISDYAAHVLSWIPADGKERLYLSQSSRFGTGSAIRGGVPIIFPQFAERGSGKRHGFARVVEWVFIEAVVDGELSRAVFELDQNTQALNADGDTYRLRYTVSIRPNALELELTVFNTSPREWSFHAALHSYFKLENLASTRIWGCAGKRFIDQADGGTERLQLEELLSIDAEVDRIYPDAVGPFRIVEQEQELIVTQQGFSDTVVWNPGKLKAAALSDMVPGDETHFVCLEAAQVERAIVLAANTSWCGKQVMALTA